MTRGERLYTDNPSQFVVSRVGQNHIYIVYIWYFWQGNHQIYGHIQCMFYGSGQP
jgi:hypothetical protein